MIKVTVGEQKTQSEKPFPKLMKNKIHGFVLLVTEYENGTVIYCPANYYKVGHTSTSWVHSQLEDLNEPITLQNA